LGKDHGVDFFRHLSSRALKKTPGKPSGACSLYQAFHERASSLVGLFIVLFIFVILVPVLFILVQILIVEILVLELFIFEVFFIKVFVPVFVEVGVLVQVVVVKVLVFVFVVAFIFFFVILGGIIIAPRIERENPFKFPPVRNARRRLQRRSEQLSAEH